MLSLITRLPRLMHRAAFYVVAHLALLIAAGAGGGTESREVESEEAAHAQVHQLVAGVLAPAGGTGDDDGAPVLALPSLYTTASQRPAAVVLPFAEETDAPTAPARRAPSARAPPRLS